jgi:hypothetical protein
MAASRCVPLARSRRHIQAVSSDKLIDQKKRANDKATTA